MRSGGSEGVAFTCRAVLHLWTSKRANLCPCPYPRSPPHPHPGARSTALAVWSLPIHHHSCSQEVDHWNVRVAGKAGDPLKASEVPHWTDTAFELLQPNPEEDPERDHATPQKRKAKRVAIPARLPSMEVGHCLDNAMDKSLQIAMPCSGIAGRGPLVIFMSSCVI